MNLTKKISIVCLTMLLIGISTFLYATMIAPTNIAIREEAISSPSIPQTFNEVKILFFSDVHYDQFLDETQLSKAIDLMNAQNPDIVLFGGDLIDNSEQFEITPSQNEQLIQLLSKIEAPLGKFAVLGEHDLYNSTIKENIENILYAAEFEVITNKSIRIRNLSHDSIVLTGIDSSLNGFPNFVDPYVTVLQEDFNITLCHTPDTVLDLNPTTTDLFLAGHSHGGEIYIPILGPTFRVAYAEEFNNGKHNVGGILVDITDGLSTSEYNARLFSQSEIVVYTLYSEN